MSFLSAVREVVNRRESLRTRFASSGSMREQLVDDYVAVDLPVVRMPALRADEQAARVDNVGQEQVQCGFHPEVGPLCWLAR
jgi:hypothetical protein